ncbi:MAG: urate hydroxylase PuuD [Pseudomonadota bacterium]|nr:urate hydroxylase PuuD [Pseudomonadota bacterium]MEC8877450.1 urate hydroxylase PuuD [Pseudomonadota bacterium]MEE3206445.1 urate hydroxylase PuuD [Pseudomonadota bacterium]
MNNPLESLPKTLGLGFALLVLIILLLGMDTFFAPGSERWWKFFFRWLHLLSGIMWIGLLWYFNFVQIPSMPKIPDEQKPAIGKVIAPTALWWFRWGAMATIVTGLILAHLSGYIGTLALGLGSENISAIGIGMWLGIIMWFNVWFVIWPNQKRALGIVEASDDAKKASARTAMLFSRTNTLLSIPMLYAMVSGHL